MSKKYASHSNQFKFKVALEALKGNRTVTELCQEFGLAASQIYAWKKKLEEAGPHLFAVKSKQQNSDADIEQLHAIIGKLKVENDFLAKVRGC
jgi:transposase